MPKARRWMPAEGATAIASPDMVDGGLPDRDGDGVPDHLDCDPDDPAIGAIAERPCSGECGSGLERCADGVWAPCDARPVTPFARPGAPSATEIGATFWASGLYVLRESP